MASANPKPSLQQTRSRIKQKPVAPQENDLIQKIYSSIVDMLGQIRSLSEDLTESRRDLADVAARVRVLQEQVDDLEAQIKAQAEINEESARAYGRWVAVEKTVLVGMACFLLGLIARTDFSVIVRMLKAIFG